MSPVVEFSLSSVPSLGGPKAEFSAWFQNSPLALALCEMSGRVLAWNPAMEQALGPVEASGAVFLSDLVRSGNLDQGETLVGELLRGQRESFQIERNPETEFGSPQAWTVWRASGVDGSAYILAAADNGLAKRYARKTGRLETLGRLTGGIAHDFNNLLTGVLLYCDLLLATPEADERARRYAGEIRRAGLQASGLVRQLLSLARPGAENTQSLSLNDVIESMRTLLERLVGENVQLTTHLDGNLGLVRINASQAQQILLNLVLNARDAMPCGGQIVVETCDCLLQVVANSILKETPTVRCALFIVKDHGNGMDARTRAHLFEPFFTTKASRGNGIGLATVHDIVSSHGGLIHVHSSPGQGTRVSVLLPVAADSPRTVSPAQDFQPATGGHSRLSQEEE